MRSLIGFGVLCFLLLASPAEGADEIRFGSVVLSLDQTVDEVRRQLGEDVRMEFARDSLPGKPVATPTTKGTRYESRIVTEAGPVRIRYDDEHGEHARLVRKDASGSEGVFLVFEEGRLTRITRLIGSENLHSAPASSVMQRMLETLATWDAARMSSISASTFDREGIREISFSSGPRRLTLTETSNLLQLVENLGRDDIETVTIEP
jgi:hypothetical protein